MPYTICTYDGPPTLLGWTLLSRRAVATLDEARELCFQAYDAADGSSIDLHESIDDLPTHGGTVGPLPDGTCIEVTRLSWQQLASATSRELYLRLQSAGTFVGERAARAAILDAYNAGA